VRHCRYGERDSLLCDGPGQLTNSGDGWLAGSISIYLDRLRRGNVARASGCRTGGSRPGRLNATTTVLVGSAGICLSLLRWGIAAFASSCRTGGSRPGRLFGGHLAGSAHVDSARTF
jgi:hypothetical protein